MTAAAVPLITTAVGIGVQAVNERQANKRRQSIIQSMLADQSKRKDASAAMTMDEAKKYSAEERAPQAVEAEQLARTDYDKALTSSENVSAPTARAGKLSAAYTTGSPAAINKQTQASKALADLMARVRGPGDLRVNEATRRGGVSEQVGSDLTDARFMAEAGGQDAASVRPNPWMQLLGQGLQTYGAVAGASAMTNAERLKTIQMMTAGGRTAAPAAGTPFTVARPG